MEAVLDDLLEQWLEAGVLGDDIIHVTDTASLTLVRERVREVGEGRLGPDDLSGILIAATELAQNQLTHAGSGYFIVRALERDTIPGVEIVAADRGDGMTRPTQALSGNTENPSGLGAGLAAVQRLTDELDLDIRMSEGSCVWARKFKTPVRRRRQIAVLGRHHPHERVSGDQATFRRTEHVLTLAMADGLGHGPEARSAANIAITRAAQQPLTPLDEALLDRHAALAGTRGAVMGMARLDEATGTFAALNVGNVSLSILGPGVGKRLGGTSFTLGGSTAAVAPGGSLRMRPEAGSLRVWDAFVMFTDGISSRAQLLDLNNLLLEHPIALAEALLTRFGVLHDDALVLVAR